MTLLAELTILITRLDTTQTYPYLLSENLLNRFNHFRKAMQLVAEDINARAGRAFLRKYDTGERGKWLNQLEPETQIDKETLALMQGFCQDAHHLEQYLQRYWKRFEKLLGE